MDILWSFTETIDRLRYIGLIWFIYNNEPIASEY